MTDIKDEVARAVVAYANKARIAGAESELGQAVLAVLDNPLRWPAKVLVGGEHVASTCTVVYPDGFALHLIDGDLVRGTC